MYAQDIKALMIRDLDKLKEEVGLYKNREDLWRIVPGISNSGGTLCLHLCGNLQHFIGSVLGNSGYVRKRDEEFSTRDIPATDLVDLVETTLKVVVNTLDGLSTEDLEKSFPIHVFGQEMTNGYFLIHLYGHLSYHLGQINYHRRITSEAVHT